MIHLDLKSFEIPEMRHPLTSLTIINPDGSETILGGRQYKCNICGKSLGDEGIYHTRCDDCRNITKNYYL